MQDLFRILEPVIDRVHAYSLNRMRSFSGISGAEMEKLPGNKINSFPKTAQIIVAGLEVEIVYRIHFSLQTAKKIVRLQKKDSSVTGELALDYMREYCNVVSGQMKALLELCDVSLAHGLPFVVEGPSDTLAPPDNSHSRLTSFWRIVDQAFGSIGCSLLIELKQLSAVEKIARIDLVEKDLAQSGEVELF